MTIRRSRRFVLKSAASVAAGAALPSWAQGNAGAEAYDIVSQNEACRAIDRMIVTATMGREEAGAWAVTVAPGAVMRMETAAAETRRLYDNAAALSDQANLNLLFANLNTLVATGIVVLAGSIATGPLLISSVLTAGVFLVADVMSAPQTPNGFTIAQDMGLNRVAAVLSVAGDDAYALSRTSAIYADGAGQILGGVGVVLAAYSARLKAQTAADLEAEEERLRVELDGYLAEIRRLNDIAYAQQFREACMRALYEDMSGARNQQVQQCLP